MEVVLDEKRRIVVPKEIADDMGLVEGMRVSIEKERDRLVIKKTKGKKDDDPLREIMSWDPKRSGKPSPVDEREIKGMWRE